MKKLVFLPILVLLLLTGVSCEKNLVEPQTNILDQESTNARKSRPIVPFNGNYITSPEFVSIDQTTGTQTFRIPSTGNATHLGRSSWYSDSDVLNTFQSPPWIQTGTSIFTAADGSKLIGTFSGTTGPTATSPFAGSGSYVITSGTGRFVGTTGNGTYSYVAAPDLSTAQLVFSGILENP
jgi:hypothetical protein